VIVCVLGNGIDRPLQARSTSTDNIDRCEVDVVPAAEVFDCNGEHLTE
jgi:hypothetical protein